MKTLPRVVSRNPVQARSTGPIEAKFNPITDLAHELCNQLTVINLCKAHLAALLRDYGDPGIAQDLDTLERAAKESTQLAERLPRLIAETLEHSEPKALQDDHLQPLPNDVLRLL